MTGVAGCACRITVAAPDRAVGRSDIEPELLALSLTVAAVLCRLTVTYALSLRVPRDHVQELRARILAIRAFNVETLLVGESVHSKEVPLVQIRWVLRPNRRPELP